MEPGRTTISTTTTAHSSAKIPELMLSRFAPATHRSTAVAASGPSPGPGVQQGDGPMLRRQHDRREQNCRDHREDDRRQQPDVAQHAHPDREGETEHGHREPEHRVDPADPVQQGG